VVLVSAHRGGGEVAARGSWAAYEDAVALGADLIEIDIRRGAGGQLVCAHDEVTDESPLLRDVLALARDAHVGGHIDLKESGYETELVELVRSYGLPYVWFTTGDDASVAALRAAGGEALLTLGPEFAGRPLPAALRDLWRAAVPFSRLKACDARGAAAQFRLAGPVLRWWCRRRGLAVLVWTINDDRRLRHFLRARGVTAVVTDRPRRAIALR
jgi:glycerophosphoryl diester phosphodiesterase